MKLTPAKRRLIESKLKKMYSEILTEGSQPALDKVAESIAMDVLVKIRNVAAKTSSVVTNDGMYKGKEFPYKNQYILEEVIAYLEKQV